MNLNQFSSIGLGLYSYIYKSAEILDFAQRPISFTKMAGRKKGKKKKERKKARKTDFFLLNSLMKLYLQL